MIVPCPSCATRFVVDPAALGMWGRTVRCARCATTWHQDPPKDAQVDFAPLRPRPETPPSMIGGGTEATTDTPMPSFIGLAPNRYRMQLPALAKPPRRISKVIIGWAALAIVLILIGTGLALFRLDLVAAWPPAARFYELVGWPVATDYGLEIRSPNAANSTADGKPVLVVAGEVANISQTPRSVPKLRLNLRNAKNETIRSLDFTAGRTRLLPGETAPFQATIPDPPQDAASALVSFGPN